MTHARSQVRDVATPDVSPPLPGPGIETPLLDSASNELVEDWSSGIADVVEEGIQSIRSAVQDEIERVEKRVGKKKKKGLFR